MHNFTYVSKAKVIFGKGAAAGLVPELKSAGLDSVLLLYGGRSVHHSGLLDQIAAELAGAGISAASLGGVQPNPRVGKVREAIAAAKASGAKAIVPLGGGSVFDSAKAVAIGAAAEQDIWDFMLKKHPVRKALPIYGILTLSGTSSEVNGTFVINNDDTQEKFVLSSELTQPALAIVDPELQYSVPLETALPSGFDALSHILEAYFEGLDTSPVIVEHCEAYARSIMRCLKALPRNLRNYDLRAELAFCSTYAHSGWAGVGRAVRGDFSSHNIGHAISGLYDVTHGVTLGLLLPAWMRYIYDQGLNQDIFSRFANKILDLPGAPGSDLALRGIEGLKEFVAAIGLPTSLGQVGISAADIPKIAAHATHALPYGSVIPMNADHIRAVLERAL